MPTTYEELAPGRAGTRRTLAVMRGLVERGKRDPNLVGLARRVVSGVAERDSRGELSALNDYVRSRVRFTRDPVGVETLSDPSGVLSAGAGDCDDQSILLATLAECVGHPTRFKVGGPDANRYRHVWVEAFDRRRQRWFPIDPINRTAPVGWEAPFAVTETLGDLPMNLLAPARQPSNCYRLGANFAPFGRPSAFFPRTHDGEKDPLLRSTYRSEVPGPPPYSFDVLTQFARTFAHWPFATSRNMCDATWSESLEGLGQETAVAAPNARIAALVAQARRRRAVPNVFGVRGGIYAHTRIGPAGEALPSDQYQRYGYLLQLREAGWAYVVGRGWVRGPDPGRVPLPPPLPATVPAPGFPAGPAPLPGQPLPPSPAPNYGYGAPYPPPPTYMGPSPALPTQPDAYQTPPPSFEQGRSYVTPTSEFAYFGAEANLTPAGVIDEEAEAVAAKPPMNPLLVAALAAGVVFLLTRKKRGGAAPALGG